MPILSNLSIRSRGKITEPTTTDTSQPERFAYQSVRAGLGNVPTDPTRTLQRRRIVTPADPQTPHQRAIRNRIAEATAAWQNAAPSVRAEYRNLATTEPINPFQLWVKHWCATHQIDPSTYALPTVSTVPGDAFANHGNPLDMGQNPAALARLHLQTL